ncbi:MAG: cytochrome c biogenesis protein ResB [Candidatus Dormibacteria bacterium]
MRTAIFFLIGVVLIVLIGSFVPQQDTSAQTKVDEFTAAHHNLNSLGAHVGLPLTEVFVSPVFYVLLGSLYLALGACVLRRGRALVQRTLRGHRRTPQYWGEWGSWLFHTSFFVLLVAVVWGKATGFQGIATITEGERFTEARAGFDTIQEGLLFNGHHAGYQVRLNHFNATYDSRGAPRDYVSNVTLLEGGRPVVTRDIRVNDFLGHDGVDLYQQDYGWAPRIVVRNPAGATVYDGTIQFFGENKGVQTGILKVPGFNYTIPGARQPLQLGARMAIFPDAQTIAHVNPDGTVDPLATNYGPGGFEARNPVIQLQLFVGDLGLDSGPPQNVNQLETRRMQPYFSDGRPVPIPLRATQPFDVPAGQGESAQFTVSFPELKQYSLFMVKKDDGVPFIYAGFILIMAGMMTKLYLRPLLEHRASRRPGLLPADQVWRDSVSGEGGREPAPAQTPASQPPPDLEPAGSVGAGRSGASR